MPGTGKISMAHTTEPKQQTNPVENFQIFWEKNKKAVLGVFGAIVVVVAGFLVYKFMYLAPRTSKANDVVFVTQKYFADFTGASDSAQALLAAKVLNGDGTNPGALKIINEYSGTDAANLSQFYAGAAYLHLGQFDKAVDFLKKFDADGALQVKSRTLGMIGDALAEMGKKDEALSHYKKAAEVNSKDDFTSSEYLFRAALYADAIGRSKESIDLFKKLKSNYPTTEKAADADRYLAKLGVFSAE